jgi:hypothetical protein
MPQISACQLPPPSNWTDFEALCADLWRAELGDLTLQRSGRAGQAQDGIDIYGRDRDSSNIGIQCKCIGSNSSLSSDEIIAEVAKAKKFRPKLSHYIFATTGHKDVRAELLCRKFSETHLRLKPARFTVTCFGWNDICLMLERHPLVAKTHFPFAIFSKAPLVLNRETSQNWEESQFSFTRPEYIHPRIVEELQGYMSDQHQTVISVDLTAANRSNRFFGEYEIRKYDGRLWLIRKDADQESRVWFEYTHVGVSSSGTHIVWTRDCGGGSGVFNTLLFSCCKRTQALCRAAMRCWPKSGSF